ncbi:STE/STE20 protein kinase [Rhizophagus clarus]|uniref:STE/STE20 protein kinase n=1 Tax=Rhizophagus clarus TaxID=94130 RepID=A0A8H3LTF3_9GLOM|nr:STE/STE20 protein kinase [Rhizophagus clarus]
MQDKADSLHSINNNPSNRTSENLVELPLPSKNQQLGKKIVKTLLIESENVVSNTQFNARPKNDTDNNMTNTTTLQDLNDDSDKSHHAGLKRVGTTVNYENRGSTSVNIGEFESKLLGSPNTGSLEQMSCAAMFGKQYLLIGNENGLRCSFKKIQILDEYGIMVAIAGKKQMIRTYRLNSLLHLIKFMLQSKSDRPVDFSKTPAFLKKITDSIQRCDDCGNPLDENVNSEGQKGGKTICKICKELRRKSATSIVSSSSTSSESNSSTTGTSLFPGKLHQRTLSNITSHLTDYIHHQLSNSLDSVDISSEEKMNVWNWATDYVKLLDNARDCVTFDVKETKNYIYLTVVTPHNMIHLFNCEVSTKNTPDFKFELAKTFWVPETPDFISVARDAFVINKIFTGMNGKVASIDAHSSVVTEINMPKVLIPRYVENPIWRSFTPLPHTCSLEFLVEDPVEFDTQISVIPLSLNFDASPLPNSYLPKSPPTSPTASIPPDTTNNAKFVNELRNNPLRRSTYRNRKSISSSNDLQSSAQCETMPITQQLPMMGQLDYVSFPASHASHASRSSPESPGSPGSPGSPESPESSSQFFRNPHNTYNPQNYQYPHIHNPESQNKANPTSSENKQQTPIEVPSPSSLFLATICNVSHLVNSKVGFQSTIIELASMKSGKIIKKITSGCPVRFLGESWIKKDFNIKMVKDKRAEFDSGMKRNVFWSCELGEEYYFYRVKNETSPHQLGINGNFNNKSNKNINDTKKDDAHHTLQNKSITGPRDQIVLVTQKKFSNRSQQF